ncbi:MAG: glycogen-binding domain-containing protein [bacterium]
MKKDTGIRAKKVSFKITTKPGSNVFVAGSFNNWDPEQLQLRDNPDSGEYKVTLPLPQGRHEYKFIVNGEWRLDPSCPDWLPNDMGSRNNVISV